MEFIRTCRVTIFFALLGIISILLPKNDEWIMDAFDKGMDIYKKAHEQALEEIESELK